MQVFVATIPSGRLATGNTAHEAVRNLAGLNKAGHSVRITRTLRTAVISGIAADGSKVYRREPVSVRAA